MFLVTSFPRVTPIHTTSISRNDTVGLFPYTKDFGAEGVPIKKLLVHYFLTLDGTTGIIHHGNDLTKPWNCLIENG